MGKNRWHRKSDGIDGPLWFLAATGTEWWIFYFTWEPISICFGTLIGGYLCRRIGIITRSIGYIRNADGSRISQCPSEHRSLGACFEDLYSPTTLYNDYATSEYLFHWQSQNSARPDRGKGCLTLITETRKRKLFCLFASRIKMRMVGAWVLWISRWISPGRSFASLFVGC